MNIPATPAERNAIMAEFLNPDYILVQPRVLYRLDGLNRFYWCVNRDGSITFFKNVTGIIGASLPTSPRLIEWMVQQGVNYVAKRDTAATYGTVFGEQAAKFVKAQSIDFGDYVEEVAQGKEAADEEEEREKEESLELDKEVVQGRMKKDLLAFNQWVRDYEVVVLAVECMLGSDKLGYAGGLDLVVKMNAFKYDFDKTPPEKRKRIVAIIDLKSGRKGFHDAHELQLHLYWPLWDEWMEQLDKPELKATHVFNWAPKAWKKTPTYSLKDQTGSKFATNLSHRIAIANDMLPDKPGPRAYIKGTLGFGADPSANYGKIPVEQYLLETFPWRFEDVDSTLLPEQA